MSTTHRTSLSVQQTPVSSFAFLLIVLSYFGLTLARSTGWITQHWSLMPVVETACLNFLVVVAVVIWLRIRQIPVSHFGLGAPGPLRTLLPWVAGTIVVDSILVGSALPILSGFFADSPQVARFVEVPGNLPLLLLLVPAVWLIGAIGEEFFFRGFLMTVLARIFGGTRAAWIAALVVQAVAFGLVHAYQGPAQAIAIGIGGAVYGAAFLLAGRNLWPVILAHGINDTLGFILLYAGVISQ